MKKTFIPRQHGYVLIFVMLSLLLMSVIVATVYSQSTQLRSSSRSLMNEQVATVNAERGLQEAFRAIRNLDIPVTNIVGSCSGGVSYTTDCLPGSYLETFGLADGGVILDNGTNKSASEGGGLQFSYVIYVAPENVGRAVYTVQATGYAGTSVTAVNTVTAVVEGEILVGTAGFKCVNSYDCTGG